MAPENNMFLFSAIRWEYVSLAIAIVTPHKISKTETPWSTHIFDLFVILSTSFDVQFIIFSSLVRPPNIEDG